MAAERATDEPVCGDGWSITRTAQRTLVSKFVGPTRPDALGAFLAALTVWMPAAEARLVFDLRELGGYNPETKEPIKTWLLEHKLAIGELVVLVPQARTMIRLVTAAIGIAVGLKITIREEPGPGWSAFANP